MADAKITELTELTEAEAADLLAVVDDPAGTPETKKLTVETLMAAINSLTVEASPDAAADFVAMYDASAPGVRKVLVGNLPVADHSASKITSGFIIHERGGLEADVSAYDGLVRITAGTTSAVTVTSFAETVLDDADAATLRATIGAASSADVAAITSGYSRRQGVAARVDNTAAPPTEVSGDRYLLDATGTSHSDWDSAAANDIVGFDGSSWVAETPVEGWIVYSDGSNTDWLFTNDGGASWDERTAGGGVTDHGALTGLTDDDHSIYSLADGSRWTTSPVVDRAVITDGSGGLVVSSVTAAELGYLDGATSNLQAQINTLSGGGGGGAGGLTITGKSGAYTAAVGDLVVCDASSGAFTLTMPASPSANDRVGVYIEHASFTLPVVVQGNGKQLAEYGTSLTMRTPGDLIIFQYDGTKWIVAANGLQAPTHEHGGLESDLSAYAGVPLIDSGSTSEIKYNLTATADPTTDDDVGDGYTVGSRWVNVTDDKEFVCLDATAAAAVWSETSHACCSGSGSEAFRTLTDGATVTLDQYRGDDFKVTLGGNRALALTNPTEGQSVLLRIIQDATGSRTLSYPASVTWPGGTAPTLTTTAGSSDWIGLKCIDASTPAYHGFVVGQGYAS